MQERKNARMDDWRNGRMEGEETKKITAQYLHYYCNLTDCYLIYCFYVAVSGL